MSTLATLDASIATWIGLTRLGNSDYAEDREGITAGDTVFQLQVEIVAANERNSNETLEAVDCLLAFHHRLADPDDEAAFLLGLGDTVMNGVASRANWITNNAAEILEVIDGPEIEDSVTRRGDVLSFSYKARVYIFPR